MSHPSLAAIDHGYPLGRPDDRDRYGMTPEQAHAYHMMIEYRDVHGELPSMRTLVEMRGHTSAGPMHRIFQCLVERGWIKNVGHSYELVDPVIRFPTIPDPVVNQ